MIRVNNLTKKYGKYVAVDNISFKTTPGELVGFVGLNGAGKTTTMRVLTGYLPLTSGDVSIGGYDLKKDVTQIKKRIGYLPENVPLYPEMRVNEYLRFMGVIKGMSSKELKPALDKVLEQCYLIDKAKEVIGRLSKGYRQRVGVAQALIADPPLLILDEPTSGLDPEQILKMRELLTSLKHNHTIFLSSHILSEVEAVCDKIIVIHKGRIIADEYTKVLQQAHNNMKTLELELYRKEGVYQTEIVRVLKSLPGVLDVKVNIARDSFQIVLKHCADQDIREVLFHTISQQGWVLRQLQEGRQNLEKVFLNMTKDSDARESEEAEVI